MTLISYLRVVYRNLPWIILFPVITAALVILLTRNIKREYATSSTLYTGVASGYNLASPMEARMDYFSVNNAFDNMIAIIKSREAVQEVNLRLMAQHLIMRAPDPSILGKLAFENRKEVFPDSLIKTCQIIGDKEKVYDYLLPMIMKDSNNVVKDIISGDHPYYSVMGFNHQLTVGRKGNSDMIEMIFKSEDPAVSKMALDILTSVFIYQYRNIKGDETSSVAQYFEEQLKEAKSKLDEAENKLKDFMVENRIINYYEQSKYVAETKENIDIEINQENMKLQAAKSALATLEGRMGQKADILKNNKQLLHLRDEISRLRVKLTRTEIYGTEMDVADSLRNQIHRLESEYKDLALKFYNNSYTLESTPQTDLLRSWLDKVLEVSEVEGRLKIYQERKLDFNKQYDQFAPWGSTLARLEREVAVSEEQYLSVLHGLNQAKLQKQNLKYANNLTVVDHAYMPLQPEKSKRMVLVLLAFAGTLFIILGYLAAKEFFDNSIKTPKRAIQQSGMPLLGALPYFPPKPGAVDVQSVLHSMIEQCLSNLILETGSEEGAKLVLISSALEREGKTWFAGKLQERLNSINRKTLILIPETEKEPDKSVVKGDYYRYPVSATFIDTQNLDELGIDPETLKRYDFIFMELPEQASYPNPIKLISSADLCLRVVNSGRVWSASDANQVTIFNKANPQKHFLVLNAVPVDALEELVGTIPRKRSRLRMFVHNYLSQNLSPSKLKSF